MIFLIKKLSIDTLENDYNKAVTYNVIGYVTDAELANSIVDNGGRYEGSGWPVEAGRIIDIIKVEVVTAYEQASRY